MYVCPSSKPHLSSSLIHQPCTNLCFLMWTLPSAPLCTLIVPTPEPEGSTAWRWPQSPKYWFWSQSLQVLGTSVASCVGAPHKGSITTPPGLACPYFGADAYAPYLHIYIHAYVHHKLYHTMYIHKGIYIYIYISLSLYIYIRTIVWIYIQKGSWTPQPRHMAEIRRPVLKPKISEPDHAFMQELLPQ